MACDMMFCPKDGAGLGQCGGFEVLTDSLGCFPGTGVTGVQNPEHAGPPALASIPCHEASLKLSLKRRTLLRAGLFRQGGPLLPPTLPNGRARLQPRDLGVGVGKETLLGFRQPVPMLAARMLPSPQPSSGTCGVLGGWA